MVRQSEDNAGTQRSGTRAGFAAIVGRPNVGKSTLLNALLGAKLAIVSQRPQTTRNQIKGVLTRGDDQLVLVDTPGIHRSRVNLNRFMVNEALASLAGVDCVILVTEVNPKRLGQVADDDEPIATLHEADRYVLDQLRQHGAGHAEIIVAVNKIDLLRDRALLLPLLDAWQRAGHQRLVPLSALRDDGVDRLIEETCALLPEGPHLYPEDMLTDRAERFLAAELIREQLYRNCHQELPYATAVEIERFAERPDREDVVIEAAIHVEREGQKAIVVGKGGTMIKRIGSAARDEIGRLLGCEVHVKLSVRVTRDWTHSPTARRRFGYE